VLHGCIPAPRLCTRHLPSAQQGEAIGIRHFSARRLTEP